MSKQVPLCQGWILASPLASLHQDSSSLHLRELCLADAQVSDRCSRPVPLPGLSEDYWQKGGATPDVVSPSMICEVRHWIPPRLIPKTLWPVIAPLHLSKLIWSGWSPEPSDKAARQFLGCRTPLALLREHAHEPPSSSCAPTPRLHLPKALKP